MFYVYDPEESVREERFLVADIAVFEELGIDAWQERALLDAIRRERAYEEGRESW